MRPAETVTVMGMVRGWDGMAKLSTESVLFPQPDVMAYVARVARALHLDAAVRESLLDGNHGITQHIINAMTNHPHHRDLAQAGMDLLVHLLEGDAADVAATRDTLRSQGALEAVVACLDHHPADNDMLRSGASALQLLANEEDVLAALRCIRGVTRLSVSGVTRLAGLALVPENVELIFHYQGKALEQSNHLHHHLHPHRDTGLESLINLMEEALQVSSESNERNDTAMSILAGTARTLGRLCTSRERTAKAVELGAIGKLMRGLSMPGDDVDCTAAALGAMARICAGEDTAHVHEFMATDDNVKKALHSIRSHKNNRIVAQNGLAFMSGIAGSPRVSTLAIENGSFGMCSRVRDGDGDGVD